MPPQVLRAWSRGAQQRAAVRLVACRKLSSVANVQRLYCSLEAWTRLPEVLAAERRREEGERAALRQLQRWASEYRCGTASLDAP